ncbi:hypothetical protein GIB67_020704 [Kingdonia uniflora]|uniref:FCP1 homology domain-containing protein n=1 Tax=Kingdonia uniflora TaxID=39325 RepID=A0A7J7NKG4_9MAGN|nr:hypothetical protein GIB67_020704 [Kingdonia uniflora]
MVAKSKIFKKIPTKTPKDRSRGRRRKNSPLKNVANASSIVIASINKSIFACQRRLIKLFTKLATVGTPNRRKKGFQRLKNVSQEVEGGGGEFDKIRRSLFPRNELPPLISLETKTVFLDLDETLIHSKTDPPPEKYDFIVRPTIEGEVLTFYVLKRPGVDQLLASISMNYEIVVFTAGLKEYASLVLDKLDTNGVISYRLYRDSCKQVDGKCVKDLSETGRDMKSVVLVDDNPNAYSLQPKNALPVCPFIDDLGDKELQKVIKFLEVADSFEDMRDAIKSYILPNKTET